MKLSPEVDFFPCWDGLGGFLFWVGETSYKTPMLCFSAWHLTHFAWAPVQDFADWM